MASRILLADDSITIHKVVNKTFEDEGIEVVAVSRGDLAEKQMSDIQPDLVLADIFMPGKNGYELCEYIKQSPQYRHVPVVLLVGAFEPFDHAEASRVKADSHLTKPFEARTLVETVRKLISTAGRPRTGPLPAMATREEETEKKTAPDARPVAPPPFNLDLAAMGSDRPAPQASSVPPSDLQSHTASSMLSEAFPLDLDYGSIDSGQQDFSAAQSLQQSQADVLTDVLTIDEPGLSEPSPFSPNVDSFVELHQPAEAPFATGPDEGESPIRPAAVSSAFDHSQDTLLDFEKLDSPEPTRPDSVVAFDVDFDGTGAADTVEPGTASGEPTTFTDVAVSYDQPAVRTTAELGTAKDKPESSDSPEQNVFVDTESAVTSDQASLEEQLHSPVVAEPELPETDFRVLETGGELGLHFSPHGETVNQPPLDLGESFSIASSAVEGDIEFLPHEEASSEPAQPLIEHSEASNFDTVVNEASVKFEPLAEVPASSSYSVQETAPADAGVSATESSPIADDWAAQQTDFASTDVAPGTQQGPSETGFDFTPVAVESPVAFEATLMRPDEQSSQASPTSADFPPEVIEQIIRRVVDTVTEEIIREIAWDVVPDVVERVVERLARESLSKRAE